MEVAIAHVNKMDGSPLWALRSTQFRRIRGLVALWRPYPPQCFGSEGVIRLGFEKRSPCSRNGSSMSEAPPS
jgi:hypothetical protein